MESDADMASEVYTQPVTDKGETSEKGTGATAEGVAQELTVDRGEMRQTC